MYIYTYLNIYTYIGFINVLYMLSYKFPNSLNNYKHSSVPVNTFPHCHLTFFIDLSATRQQATWYWLEGLFRVRINIAALSKHLPNGWGCVSTPLVVPTGYIFFRSKFSMRDHSPLSGRQLPQPWNKETTGKKESGATAGPPEAQESGSCSSRILLLPLFAPLCVLPYSGLSM